MRTWQSSNRLLRMLATRIMRQGSPSWYDTTAWWLNFTVSPLFLGRATSKHKKMHHILWPDDKIQYCRLIKFGILYLCEKGSCDEDLQHHGDDQLEDEKDNGNGTLLCDAPETVAYCGLRLQREEEGSCQGLYLHDTRGVVGRRVELWRFKQKKGLRNVVSCTFQCKWCIHHPSLN